MIDRKTRNNANDDWISNFTQGAHADLITVTLTASDFPYTLSNTDNNTYFRCNDSGAMVINHPAGLMETLYIAAKRVGSGELTHVGASGVKFQGVDAATLRHPVGSDLGGRLIFAGFGTLNEFDVDGVFTQSDP